MERLTHKCDLGFEDWEQIGYMVADDKDGFYNILDIAGLSDKPNMKEILKNVSVRLATYEGTELEPGEIEQLKQENEELRELLKSAVNDLKTAVNNDASCYGCLNLDKATKKCTSKQGVESCNVKTNNMWQWQHDNKIKELGIEV